MKDYLQVAIADDDEVCREFLFRVLRRMGHEVVCQAENGRQLVDYCRYAPPDLVITDVHMPEMDGISAAAEIARQHDVPIVLLSGSDLPMTIEPLQHVHLLVCRAKPVSRGDLEGVFAEMEVLSGTTAVA